MSSFLGLEETSCLRWGASHGEGGERVGGEVCRPEGFVDNGEYQRVDWKHLGGRRLAGESHRAVQG